MIQFSVIMPLYNKANFVRKSIESILDQTYKDFEIIVVNDGSTDRSLAVVNEIRDPRIRIFSKENGGVSAARNFGLEKAQYDYIAFLDADDLWSPNFLETMEGMIEQYPQTGIFATSYTEIDNSGKKNMYSRYLPKGETVLVDNYCRYIVKGYIYQVLTIALCVKKNLFDITGGFREGVKRGEDTDMWLRLSLVSPIVWKNESTAIYNRITENNATAHYDSYKNDFPYWEMYAYGSSIYLKLYVSRLMKRLLKQADFRDRIHILPKINWFYTLMHFFRYIGYKMSGKKSFLYFEHVEN